MVLDLNAESPPGSDTSSSPVLNSGDSGFRFDLLGSPNWRLSWIHDAAALPGPVPAGRAGAGARLATAPYRGSRRGAGAGGGREEDAARAEVVFTLRTQLPGTTYLPRSSAMELK